MGNRKRFHTDQRPTCFLHRLLYLFNNKKMNFCNCKPTHLATATHATIVASALVIRPLASVTSRAARNEQNNNINNVNVSYLFFVNRFVFCFKTSLRVQLQAKQYYCYIQP